jgi:hypothetical protein
VGESFDPFLPRTSHRRFMSLTFCRSPFASFTLRCSPFGSLLFTGLGISLLLFYSPTFSQARRFAAEHRYRPDQAL